MPLAISILTSNFGKVGKGEQNHYASVGFKITGAVGVTPTFQKSLDSTNWFPFNEGNYDWNLDGYTTEYVLPKHNYNFYVRQVGYESDVASVLNYAIIPDITSMGLHPLGNTPKILNSTISVGANIPVSIETVKAGELVKLYGSILEGSQEVFKYEEAPLAEGFSNGQKLFIGTVNLREGQKICASAQGEFELESYSTNTLTVGTVNNKKLDIMMAVKNVTANGRTVNVSVTGGSGNYAVSIGNSSNFNLQINTDFELLFGRQSITVKDTLTGALYSRAVHILPAGQQTVVNISLRKDFSNSANPNGRWKYGSIQNNTFTEFTSFGIRAGFKEGWGIGLLQLPMIGYGENSNPLGSNAIVMSPNHDAFNANNNHISAVYYTFNNAGVFNSTVFNIKKPTIGNIGSTQFMSKYTVMLNGTALLEGVLTFTNETVPLTITNLEVQSGDILKILVDSASSLDNASALYDDVHVEFDGQLATTTYASPTAPNAPTLVAGTGNSITEIFQGETIKIRTTPNTNWIQIKRNNIVLSYIKSALATPNYESTFIGGRTSNISVRTVSDGVFSSGQVPSFQIRELNSVVPPAPVVSTTSGTVGSSNTITCPSLDELVVYLGVSIVAMIKIAQVNQVISYSYLTPGTYSFKILKGGLLSAASQNVVITASNNDCTPFIDGFSLGTFGANAYALSTFVYTGKKLIKQLFDIPNAMIIRNGNFLNYNTVVSNYKGTSCFAHPKNHILEALGQADIGNIAGYKWLFTTDGTNTPYLLPDTSVNKSYRVAASTPCDGEIIKFAISPNKSNPIDIADEEYMLPDGTMRVNSDNIEDPSASPKFYKIFTVPSGVYNVFYKVDKSLNTPVVVVSHNFQ